MEVMGRAWEEWESSLKTRQWDDERPSIYHRRLAAQQQECERLRAALRSLQQAKEDDLRHFSDMMDQVKHIFSQALRQHKQDVLRGS